MDDEPWTPADLVELIFGLGIGLAVAWILLAPPTPNWCQGTPVTPWWAADFASIAVCPGTMFWSWSDERVEATTTTLDLLGMLVGRGDVPEFFKDHNILPAVRLGALIWWCTHDVPAYRCIDAGEVVFRNPELLKNTDQVDAYHVDLVEVHMSLFDPATPILTDVPKDLEEQLALWKDAMVSERQ